MCINHVCIHSPLALWPWQPLRCEYTRVMTIMHALALILFFWIIQTLALVLFLQGIVVVIGISRVFAALTLLVHHAAQHTAFRLCQVCLRPLEVLLVSVCDVDYHEYSINLGRKNV